MAKVIRFPGNGRSDKRRRNSTEKHPEKQPSGSALASYVIDESQPSEPMTAQQIAMSLYGIMHLHELPSASVIVHLLSWHAHAFDTSQLPPYQTPERYFADILNSLTPYLTSNREDARAAALGLIHPMMHRLRLPTLPTAMPLQQFCEMPFLDAVILDLLRNNRRDSLCDFTGCSRRLAERLGRQCIDHFLRDEDASSMTMRFAVQGPYWEEQTQMKSVAATLVDDVDAVEAEWYSAWVVLYKKG